MTATGATLLVVAISLATALVGRLFTGAFGGDLFRRFDPAGAAASLAAGTAVLTLLSVSLSSLGFPTRELPQLVTALMLLPFAIALLRDRLDVLLPEGRLVDWALFLAPVALTAGLALLPVTSAGGFQLGGDTYTYGAFSEWLQDHAFSEKARAEAQSPVTAIPSLWQSQGYDLGVAHWLALVQAAVRPASVLLVYPSTSAFGLVLLAATLWLAVVQLLRLGRSWAGATALVFAAVPHALYWGHHDGFLQQGYALPFVIFGLLLVARVAARRRRDATDAALLALPLAFLFVVYMPLLPLLGCATVVGFVPAFVRARRERGLPRLVRFAAALGVCVAAYATRDVIGALSPLHGFATHVAGGHIPWRASDFFQFALGTRVLAPGWINVELAPWSALNRALTPLYGALVLVGLSQVARPTRTRPLATAAGLVALAALYFALAVKDPWSGERGHTWNLFKLAQWGWPFALLLAALGVRRLAPARPPWRAIVLALAVVLPASQIGVHWPWSTHFGDSMREILPGMTFGRLGELEQRVQRLPPGTLLVVGRPANAHRWLATTLALLAYPRSLVGDWVDSGTLTNEEGGVALYARLLERWSDPNVVPILAGYLPFQAAGVEELGGGLAWLRRDGGPLLVHVVNPTGLRNDPASARPTFDVGKGRTKLVVFSPRGGPAQLALALEPYPGRPGIRFRVFYAAEDYSHRSVRLASESTPIAVLPLGGETAVRVPLALVPGLSTIVLVLDEGRGNLDARQPVTVAGLSLEPAQPAGAGGAGEADAGG